MDKRRIWRVAGLIPAVAAPLGVTSVAGGQNSWVIDVQYSDPAGVINSLGDTATITLWASWDPAQYAFRNANLDVRADDIAGYWSEPNTLLKGPYWDNGTIDQNSIVGIVPSQFHNPIGGQYADTANPIAVWTAIWQTSNLHPRDVAVTTDSTGFSLYIDFEGNAASFIDSLDEGSEVITVVPAVGASAVLLPGIGVYVRRRRAIARW